jgi:hypothetical protein
VLTVRFLFAFLISFFFLQFTLANESLLPAAELSDGYCQRTMKTFQRLAYDESYRLAFANHGGLVNGGVCWWHSRLQRNAVYFARFALHLDKPTAQEASRLVSAIIDEKGPVVIPGYSSFNQFSRDFERMIQKKLEGWQRKDGFLKFGWIKGLKGSDKRDPVKFRRVMDSLYEKVGRAGEIAFAKLQIPGIASHAWLIIGMVQTSLGYKLYYVDSNEPIRTSEHEYRDGDQSVMLPGSGYVGFYEGYSGTMEKVRERFFETCGHALSDGNRSSKL